MVITHNSGFKIVKILPLILALMIDNMSFGAIFPLVTSMFQEHPTTFFNAAIPQQIVDNFMGLAYMIMPLGMLFGASFLGDLSDVWGRRKTMILAMFGIGIGYIFMFVSIAVGSIWLFLFGRLITGLMAGSQPVAQAAIIDVSTPETKAINMNFIAFSVSIGFTLGPVIAGVFSSIPNSLRVGFELPFIVIGAGAFISSLWLFTSFKETSKAHPEKKLHLFRIVRVFIEGIKHKSIRVLAPMVFFFQLATSLFFQTFVIKMQSEFGYDTLWLGWITGFYGIVCMFGFIVFVRHTIQCLKVESYCVLALLLNGLFMLVFASIHSEILAWILIIFIGTSNAAAYTSAFTSVSDSVHVDSQGWGMGVLVATIALAFMVGGALMTLLKVVGFSALLYMGGLSVIVASLIMLYYIKCVKLKAV